MAPFIMYADKMTNSMRQAIDETDRRRDIQIEYNKKHNITPQTIVKPIQDIIKNHDTKMRLWVWSKIKNQNLKNQN